MSARRNWSILKQKIHLTEEERRMYAAEKLDNFRWAAQLLASCSPVSLTAANLVPVEIQSEIRDIGQFAEIIYTSVPIELLLKHIDILSGAGFPLEEYRALRDGVLEDFFLGDIGKLPVALFRRPAHSQIVISISGTSHFQHALHDLRVLKTNHPSGKGSLHSGFWALYTGIITRVKAALQKALEAHNPAEVVLTGHSMGGAVAYLLGIGLLSGKEFPSLPAIKLVTFGSPRVADAALVTHFRDLVANYKQNNGESSFVEYSVRGYNDGVPALPPMNLGYRHFASEPIYSTGDQLYAVPSSECEYTLFHVEGTIPRPSRFPRGGHNYYSGRELERLRRHITWLEKANLNTPGWEGRYKSMAEKNIAKS